MTMLRAFRRYAHRKENMCVRCVYAVDRRMFESRLRIVYDMVCMDTLVLDGKTFRSGLQSIPPRNPMVECNCETLDRGMDVDMCKPKGSLSVSPVGEFCTLAPGVMHETWCISISAC